MKEAMGGIPIFQIVIIFILLFTGIMCLTINHSKAFSVKDEIVTIIQNNQVGSGELNSTTMEKIVDRINKAGYRITGTCPDGYFGYTKDGKETSKGDASFCVRSVDVVNEGFYPDLKNKCKPNKCETTSGDFPNMTYYEVLVFYQLDIPGLNSIMRFTVKGSTKILFG